MEFGEFTVSSKEIGMSFVGGDDLVFDDCGPALGEFVELVDLDLQVFEGVVVVQGVVLDFDAGLEEGVGWLEGFDGGELLGEGRGRVEGEGGHLCGDGLLELVREVLGAVRGDGGRRRGRRERRRRGFDGWIGVEAGALLFEGVGGWGERWGRGGAARGLFW